MRTKFGRRPGCAALAVEPLEPRDAPSATQYVLSGISYATAGSAASLTVQAVDGQGVIDPYYTGTIHFSSTDRQAGLPADYAFTLADGGQHVFNVTLDTAGSQSVTGTDTALPSFQGTLGGVPVGPAAASTFVVSGFPASVAGANHSFTVTAEDPYGNIDTYYGGTVEFFSSAYDNNLPAPYTFGDGDGGEATFSGSLNTAGTQSIIAQDVNNSSLIGSQTGIVISPGPTTGFLVSGPEALQLGSATTVTVTAVDDYANTTAGYRGRVAFTSTDPLAILPRDYTFTAGDAGTHAFAGFLFRTAGTQLITVTDAASLAGGTGVWVFVSRGAGVRMSVSPAEISAGAAATVAGTLSAPSQLPLTVTLDWGDGSPPTTLTLDPGVSTFAASHTYSLSSADYPNGAFTIRAAANVTGSRNLPLIGTADVIVDSVSPDVAMDRYFAFAHVGDVVTLTGTYTDPGGEPLVGMVNFDDGSAPQFVTLRKDGTFTVSHVFTDEDVYDVAVLVDDGTGVTWDDTLVLVFAPQLEGGHSQAAAPGGEATASGAGVTAKVDHAAGARKPADLTIGRYDTLPVTGALLDPQTAAAYELRVAGATADDRVTVTFAIPSGAGDRFRLDFYDTHVHAFLPVRYDPDSVMIDEKQHTITFVLDESTFPQVTDLHGTIFTITVALPEGIPVGSAVAAVAYVSAPAAPAASAFSSGGQRTLTLSPSSDGGPSAGKAFLSGERSHDDADTVAVQVAATPGPWAVEVEVPLAGWGPTTDDDNQGRPSDVPLWPLTPARVVPVWPLTLPPPRESSDHGALSRPPKDEYWTEPSAAVALAALALAPGLMLPNAARSRAVTLPGENPSSTCPI